MSKTILTKKATLSKRQYEILILRAMKMKYPDIERKLSISKGQLRRHIINMLAKTNSFSQSELIDIARHQGWIKSSVKPTGEVEYQIRPYEHVHTIRVYKSVDG